MVRVTLFGHSQVKWLHLSQVTTGRIHPGLEYEFVAQGGLNWERVFISINYWLERIEKTNPHIVVIHMGTNDMSYPELTPEYCAEKLRKFIKALDVKLKRKVPILLPPCFAKTEKYQNRYRQIPVSEFNERAQILNEMYLEMNQQVWRLHYSKWVGKNRLKMFRKDLIHTSEYGNRKFFYYIQLIVLKLEKGAPADRETDY